MCSVISALFFLLFSGPSLFEINFCRHFFPSQRSKECIVLDVRDSIQLLFGISFALFLFSDWLDTGIHTSLHMQGNFIHLYGQLLGMCPIYITCWRACLASYPGSPMTSLENLGMRLRACWILKQRAASYSLNLQLCDVSDKHISSEGIFRRDSVSHCKKYKLHHVKSSWYPREPCLYTTVRTT